MGEALIVRRGAKEPGPLVIEAGLIVEFFGLSSNIPDGWQLCDGTNDTPNLIDKFILGAGDIYSINDTGGSADAVVPSHNHSNSSTGTDGTLHNHSFATHAFTFGSLISEGTDDTFNNTRRNTTTAAAGAHSHTVTVSSEGDAATDKNLPPYFSIIYIIKLED